MWKFPIKNLYEGNPFRTYVIVEKGTGKCLSWLDNDLNKQGFVDSNKADFVFFATFQKGKTALKAMGLPKSRFFIDEITVFIRK